MKTADVLSLIKDRSIVMVDLQFTDTRGQAHHITLPGETVDESLLEDGKMFDGSSITGWKEVNESDMVLVPDLSTIVEDPFARYPTLIIRCDVMEPDTLQPYGRDPRSIARQAEAYLRSTGIADFALFGPENEFFVFDDVRWTLGMGSCSLAIQAAEAPWTDALSGVGHRPAVKGGYLSLPPVDRLAELRTEMCMMLKAMGLGVEAHHHEVATAGQCEIGVNCNTLVSKADEVMLLKYAIHNTAQRHGKTVTFMPKPIVGDQGSGMHIHQSLAKAGQNLFSGDAYGGLSHLALYYIGGILHHAHALNAFCNASTNSYRRLIPGFEAPVLLAYSARNRSASIRIPYVINPHARRIEVRFPDATANPYLAMSAMLMAGLDGIQRRLLPGPPVDKDLYDLPKDIEEGIPHVAASLDAALDALDSDRDFLRKGGVFTDDAIDAYIAIKREEFCRCQQWVHPVEFEMYYSL